MGKTVCFTGHRQIPDADYLQLEEALHAAVEEQIKSGATHFRTGGALGFDTLAALSVLSMRKRFPEIRLELILPYPDQALGWSENDARLYRQILSQADSHRYIAQTYYHGLLQQRNRALVEKLRADYQTVMDQHRRYEEEAEALSARDRELLEGIRAISESLGFADQFYFSRKFKKKFGQTPLQYRQSNRA